MSEEKSLHDRTLEAGRECLEKYDGAFRMMASTKPDNAPGCWGAALAYDENELVCCECWVRESCKSVSEQRAKALRASLGVETLVNAARPVKQQKPLKQAEKAPSVDGSDKASLPNASLKAALPVKVQELLGRLLRKGINLSERLKTKRFEDLPIWLRRACEFNSAWSFTRAELRDDLMEHLSWSRGTSDAHVGQYFCLLKHLDLAREEEGKLILNVEAKEIT